MSLFWDTTHDTPKVGNIISAIVFVIMVLTTVSMAGCPQYNVYEQRTQGEAELQRANYSKQVAVQEAQAKMDAAKLLAAAEIERAKGVAKANQIIGDSLHNNEDYLRYLFVNNLEHTQNQVIYIPTEANMPILEASRFRTPLPAPAH
jgi:regulator of protease activity HflC (stomatin/prohibitin superfamily)